MDTENKKDKEDKEDKEEDSWQPVRSPRVAQVGRAVEIVAVSTRPIFPTLSLTDEVPSLGFFYSDTPSCGDDLQVLLWSKFLSGLGCCEQKDKNGESISFDPNYKYIHSYIYIIYILYIFWYICRQIIDKRFRSHSPKKVGCLSSSTPFSRLAGGSRQDRFVVSTASHPCCTLAARCIGCMLFSFTASLPKEFQSLCMKDSSGQIPTQKNTA